MCGRLVVLIGLLFAAMVVTGRPTFSPTFNGHPIDTPTPHPDNPLRYQMDYHHVDESGRHLHFAYDVTHSAGVLSLDGITEIEAVECGADALKIVFRTGEAAALWAPKFAVNSFVVGGLEWNCVDSHGKAALVHRRVTAGGTAAADGSLTIGTAACKFHELFESADVRFHTNQVEKKSAPPTQSVVSPSRRRLSGFFSDILSSIVSTAESVYSTVSSVVEGLADVAAGDLSFDKTGDIPFKKSFSTTLFQDDGLTVTASVDTEWDLSVEMQLNIESYSVQSLLLQATGSVSVNPQMELTANYQYSKDGSKRICTISGPKISFSIGAVPVWIATSLPIDGVWSVSMDASLDVTVSASLSASASLGTQYDGSDWYPVNSLSFDASINQPTVTASANVGGQIGLQFTLELDFYSLGGPTVGVMPFFRVDGSYDSSSGTLTLTEKLEHQESVGLEISLGAFGSSLSASKKWDFDASVLQQSTWSYSYGSPTSSFFPSGTPALGIDIDEKAPISVPLSADNRPVCPANGGHCVVAHDLTYCPQLNGFSVCATESGLAKADAEVADILKKHSARGLSCVDSLQRYICETKLPRCAADAKVEPICFDDCVSNFHDRCGLSDSHAKDTCLHATRSAYASLAAPSQTVCSHLLPSSARNPRESVVASGLTTCEHSNGRTISLDRNLFSSTAEADSFVLSLATQTMSSASRDCWDSGVALLCAEYLPEVADSSNAADKKLCHKSCVAVFESCGTTRRSARVICEAYASPLVASVVASAADSSCGYESLATSFAPSSNSKVSDSTWGWIVGGVLAFVFVCGATISWVVISRRRSRGKQQSSLEVSVPFVSAQEKMLSEDNGAL